jgi:hypothetical protein
MFIRWNSRLTRLFYGIQVPLSDVTSTGHPVVSVCRRLGYYIARSWPHWPSYPNRVAHDVTPAR